MEKTNLLSRKKFTMDEFFTQMKVSAENEIKRVLSLSPSVSFISKDCLNGMVNVSGKINLKMVYVSASGTIECAEGSSDFIEKQQTSYALDDLFLTDDAEAVNVNFSGTDAIVSIKHNVTVCGTFTYGFDSGFEDEDLVLDKKTFSSLKLSKSAEDNFVVAYEAETNLKNVAVLSSSAKVLPVEVSASVDKIVVEGKVLAFVTVKDDETVSLVQREIEFKQEISAEGVTPNMVARADAYILNITVTPEEKDEKTTLVYAVDVFAKAYAYEEASFDVVTDMFSLKNILSTTNDFLETKNYVETKYLSENKLVLTNVAEIDNFDDIIGVFEPNYKYVSSVQNENSVTINGLIEAVALYKAGDEVFKLDISEPVEIEVQTENKNIVSKIQANAQIVSYKVKAGKELETNFKIDFAVDFDTIVSEMFVKSFERKEEREVSKGGVTVYVAGQNDSIFDVAKSVGVRPEDIAKQNDDVKIFDQGDKIYIYSPINLI